MQQHPEVVPTVLVGILVQKLVVVSNRLQHFEGYHHGLRDSFACEAGALCPVSPRLLEVDDMLSHTATFDTQTVFGQLRGREYPEVLRQIETQYDAFPVQRLSQCRGLFQ